MPELVTDDHLGGFVPGGDKATWYPALWQWFVRDCGVHFVLDVGCGDGVALRYFRDLDCNVVGIDGVEQIDRDIVRHDFNDGPWLHPLNVNFDLCWCCEFVEHVEERYMPNYLEAFTLARYVLMTHAEPGQQGHHHVHCQTADYWKGTLAAVGFSLDPVLTARARELAAFNPNPYNHFVRSGMVFKRV